MLLAHVCSFKTPYSRLDTFPPFNSLAPGRSACDSQNGIFNLVLLIGIFRSSYDNGFRWIPQVLTDIKSTLVQVMAWCRQATSHYLGQCWLGSLSPYGVTRPQWVNNPEGGQPYLNNVVSGATRPTSPVDTVCCAGLCWYWSIQGSCHYILRAIKLSFPDVANSRMFCPCWRNCSSLFWKGLGENQ